jgi:4-alpha-glucanotransferase
MLRENYQCYFVLKVDKVIGFLRNFRRSSRDRNTARYAHLAPEQLASAAARIEQRIEPVVENATFSLR